MTLGQNDSSVENTVIKLASASVLEIFKDIIPNYKISDHETQDKTVKLKKDTLNLKDLDRICMYTLATCCLNPAAEFWGAFLADCRRCL